MNNLKKIPSNKYPWGYDLVPTTRHKIRLFIGIVGSMIKNGKEYFFYGVMKEKYNWFDKIHHRVLQKLTPFLNKII